MNELPTIESGKIWENRSTKEILLAIQKGKKADYAIARMASEFGEIDGEFLIVKSTYVHGARLLEDKLTGFDALATLLTIDHGTYSLMDCSEFPQEAAHLEEGLKIRLNLLVNALPNLPATAEELALTGSAMTRMRSYEGNELPSGEEKAEAKSAKKLKPEGSELAPVGDARERSGLSPVMIAIIVMVIVLAGAGVMMFVKH
ncbi:hypothetical protein KA344_04610 [bacterium]|jgi:hypothetical protein|nr:hypothetical protein [bacterium]